MSGVPAFRTARLARDANLTATIPAKWEGHPTPPPRSREKSVLSQHANRPPLAGGREVHLAGPRREDRVIAPEPRALAGPELGPALPHDDLATGYLLAGEDLDPEHVRVRFASVAAGPESFLM